MDNFSDVRFASALVAALSVVASVSGCGSKVPFDFVPVHGKVTYEDGTPIAADSILVLFNPIVTKEKGKFVPPGGQTYVNVQDGTFSAVSSHRKDDGVAVGRHKVVVVAFGKGPNGSTVPSTAVPAIYHKESTTPLEVEVESSDQFLDLKVRKK
jgi:predicted small lipoprotein YifL